MKTILLFFALILSSFNFIFAQCPGGTPDPSYTCIPDSAFENALIVRGIDSEGTLDGQVLTGDLNSAVNIEVSGFGITDLTGIEQCTSLLYLNILNNSISGSLDLNASTSLLSLTCNNNFISSIDVTNCAILNTINCDNNDLMTLDLSNKGNLEQVVVNNNPSLSSINLTNSNFLRVIQANSTAITSLDLTDKTGNLNSVICVGSNLNSLLIGASTKLFNIDVRNNQLTDLDLSQFGGYPLISNVSIQVDDNLLESLNVKNGYNNVITTFSALNNNLTCITVDDAAFSTSNWTNIDPGVSFSTNCALGIKDFNKESISLYPNPTKNNINIELQANVSYSLTNFYGQVIESGKFASGDNILDIHTLTNGLYFLSFETDEGNITKKIIKH